MESEFGRRTGRPASVLHLVDKAFAAQRLGRAPMMLDCAALTAASTGEGPGPETDPDGPPSEVPLPVLRDWLMAHPRAYPARDAVWRELIRRARQGPSEWVIAAIGMAMPALVAMAGTLAAGYSGDAADIDSEILAGFLEGLHVTVDPAVEAPYASLCFTAWRAGRELRLSQQEHLLVPDIERVATSCLPRVPYGHPDLLVYRAQALGILDGQDVEPYIAVRLGHRVLELIAEARRIDPDVLRMRLNRADARLAEALASGAITGTCSPDTLRELARRRNLRAKTRAGKAAARATGTDPQPEPALSAA